MASSDNTFAAIGGAAHRSQIENIEGAVAQAGHHFYNDVAPAVGGAVAHVQNNVAPAVPTALQGPMAHIGDRVGNFGAALAYNTAYQVQVNIAPAIRGAITHVGEVIGNIGPAIKETTEAAIARLREIFGEKFENAPQILLQSVEEAQIWVKANPGKTVLLMISTLTIVAPVIIVGPALAILGFGAGGVAAGKLSS
jgi:hypothetical protein